MNRKELKKEAKKVLKRNYLKCIIVAFIVGIILSTGYNLNKTVNYREKVKKTDTLYTEKDSAFDEMEKFFDKLNLDIRLKSDLEKTKGIAAPIVNKLSENKSPLLYLLNSIDLAFFKNNINGAFISLITLIILLINYFFLQNLITIGNARFYLEARRYNKTSIEKLLYPYKRKKIPHLAYVMFMKKLYLFLWNLTIIGGFIKYYEYMMIDYVLAENPYLTKKEAFKLSKELTYGHKFELFKVDLSLIGWVLLSFLTFGFLNLFFLNSYKDCLYTECYMNLKELNKDRIKAYKFDNKLAIKEPVDNIYQEDETKPKKQRDFNKKYSFSTYILFFFSFAFVGWAYEVALHLVKDGVFVNRGTMFGPWLPIYGFGAVFILFLLKPFRKNYLLYFISAIVLAGVLEYSTSWALETFKGMKWWDYSGYFLNLNGRICFEGLLVFGLGGCAVTYLVAPVLDDLYSKIKPKIRVIICAILVLLYGADMVYSHYHPNSGKGITDYESE